MTKQFWIAGVIVLAATVFLFTPLADSVTAQLGNEHTVAVLGRIRNEIMLRSPAGQYYEAMFWKHNSELLQIGEKYPGHYKELLRVTRMFIPGLEALLDGKGDSVRITEEQIKSLKAELDWHASVGSPSLREDIQKEQERFPLKNFIGMTMSEALDYINSNWSPELTAEPTVEPTQTSTEAPPATPIPTCLVGSDSSCLTEPSLVPDTTDLWAYYIYNGVYFEYPSDWQIQKFEEDRLVLLPTQESPEGANTRLLGLLFSSNLLINNWPQVLTTSVTYFGCSNNRWRQLIYLTDFQGFECYSQDSHSSAMFLEFFLYNENDQISVGLVARIEDEQTADLLNNPDAVKDMFPGIQHIIESFRLWKP